MKNIFIYTILLFLMTVTARPIGSATVTDSESKYDNVIFNFTIFSENAERAKQLKCLAKNIYFEARNEPFAGQLAVAMVTLNRVYDEKFPNTLCEVVYEGRHWASGHPKRHRCQFSWYCDGNSDNVLNKTAFKQSQNIASIASEAYLEIKEQGLDITEGARYYHTYEVSPSWSKVYPVVGRIGDHIFYR